MAYFTHHPAPPRVLSLELRVPEHEWQVVIRRLVDARESPERYAARCVLKAEQALVDELRQIRSEVDDIRWKIGAEAHSPEALDILKHRMEALDAPVALIERVGVACGFKLNLAI